VNIAIPKKPTQAEIAKIMGARDLRVAEIQPSSALAVLANVVAKKTHNQRIFIVTVVG
jgi:hypothetical protein